MEEVEIKEVLKQDPDYGIVRGLAKAWGFEKRTRVHEPSGTQHVVDPDKFLLAYRSNVTHPWRVRVANQQDLVDHEIYEESGEGSES